ncbi:hypothetical protein B296_00030628 [Ensete ventricosum]|uniref:Uncharacterized protein n=1 Tax=Ensete ventricosum TaxID=4639 RepID=A0A426XL24_ENSVE|nr:hypothetical protein B296_00030628 [Ensete ventricosum]
MSIARAATCRGDACGYGWLRPSRRGDTRKVDRLQGTGKGLPPATCPTASRGSGVSRRGGDPLAGWLPTGKGSRRLRRGSSDGDDGVEGARGLGHHFEKRTILKILSTVLRDPRCRSGRSRRIVIRRSDGTDDDEINNHRA